MPSLELNDIVPDYPREDDPLLAAKLYALREFRELEEPFGWAPNPFEDDPTRKTLLYNHQEIVTRYLSPLLARNRALIMPDPGLGKTPIGVILAEQVARKDNHAVIFTQNPVMEQNFKDNIAKFVPNKYAETAQIEGEEAVKGLDKIADYYDFHRYDTFGSLLLAKFDAETHDFEPGFIESFRGRRIIMDESHHIRATRQERRERFITDEALERVCGTDEKTGKSRAGWMRGVRETYRAFFLFLHLIQDCDVFFLTATPMVDRKTEACFQMNLLLPVERLFVADNSSFEWFQQLEGEDLTKEMYKHCRGMISYARSKYRARRVDKGETIGTHETGQGPIDFITKFVSCPMSKEQYAAVTAIEEQEGGARLGGEGEPDAYGAEEANPNSFRFRSRAASSMVFPYKGKFVPGLERTTPKEKKSKKGKKGEEEKKKKKKSSVFHYYFEQGADRIWRLRDPDTKDPNYQQHKQDVHALEEQLRDLKTSRGLAQLSSKYLEIIKTLNTDKDNDRRVTYVYSPLLEGSGLVALMVAMSLNGYEQYVPQGRNAVARLVEANKSYAKAHNGALPRRVALISGSTSPTDVREIKKVLNSPQNARGELIHVVLGSPSSGESISFHNVRRTIVASPTWNDALLRQAIGRSFRLDSHKERDFRDEDAFVDVIILAATPPKAMETAAKTSGEELPVPTDVYILMLAELKGRNNGGAYRAMKQCSFDGVINRRLNQRPGETEITAENDYSTGTYDIVSGDIRYDEETDSFIRITEQPSFSEKNYSLYYNRARTQQREAILKLFRTRTSATLDEIVRETLQDRQAVLFALNQLIEERIQIQDASGARRYLRETDNVYFLQPEYGDADPFLEHYARCTYVEQIKDTSEHIEESTTKLIEQIVALANADPENADEFFTSLYEIVREKIGLLFEGYIDGRYELTDEVSKVFLGRLRTSIGKVEYDDGTETVYHKLYYLGEKRRAGDAQYAKGTDLKTAQQLGRPSRMRVFDVETWSWRFATNEEDESIVRDANAEWAALKEGMKDNYVYGILFPIDGALHPYFPGKEKTRTTKGSAKQKKTSSSRRSKKSAEKEEIQPAKDKRYEQKIGKDASAENKSVLVEILWRLAQDSGEYYLDYEFDPETSEKRVSMIADMRRGKTPAVTESRISTKLNQMSDEQLHFFWWFLVDRKITNRTHRKEGEKSLTLANLLKERLLKLDLVIEH